MPPLNYEKDICLRETLDHKVLDTKCETSISSELKM